MQVHNLLELFMYLDELQTEYALSDLPFEPFAIWFAAEEILCISFQNFEPNKDSLKANGIVWDEYQGCHIYVI